MNKSFITETIIFIVMVLSMTDRAINSPDVHLSWMVLFEKKTNQVTMMIKI